MSSNDEGSVGATRDLKFGSTEDHKEVDEELAKKLHTVVFPAIEAAHKQLNELGWTAHIVHNEDISERLPGSKLSSRSLVKLVFKRPPPPGTTATVDAKVILVAPWRSKVLYMHATEPELGGWPYTKALEFDTIKLSVGRFEDELTRAIRALGIDSFRIG